MLSIPEEFENKKLRMYSLFPAGNDNLVRKIEKIGDNQIVMLRNIDENIIALKSQLQGKATYGVSKQHGMLEIYNRGT